MKKDLTTGSLSDAIKGMAIPASIGLFFHAMYNVTDTFYAGQLSIEALAALAITFPLFFLVVALGSGINIATNAFVSKKIGEKNYKKAIELGAQGLSLSFIIGVLLSFLGILFIKDLLILIGAKGLVLSLSVEYMQIILLAIPLIFIHWTLRGILGSIGDTKTPGILMIITFFLNLFLDPILMYGYFGLPALGISGVALATVLLILFEVVVLIYVSNKKEMFCRNVNSYFLKLETVLSLVKQAIPASLSTANTAIGFLIITKFVTDFGDAAIATFGIGARIDQLIILPSIGIGLAAISTIGQNYGAKKFERVLETYKTSMKYSTVTILIGVVLIFAFSQPLASLFTDDPELIDMVVIYLYIITISYIPTGILIVSSSALQGLGRAQDALILNLMRVFAFSIPSFWVLAYLLNLKEIGIWVGITLSTLLIAIISYSYVLKIIEREAKN